MIVNPNAPSDRSLSQNEFCRLLAEYLSRCWLSEELSVQQRIEIATGLSGAWMTDLAQAVCARYRPTGGYARRGELSVRLNKQPAIKRFFRGKKIRSVPLDVWYRLTRAAAQRAGWTWQVPEIDSQDELCRLLELKSFSTLDWLVLPHRRRDFEKLKAELNNCVHHGWRSQNRRQLSEYAAHLRGRIARVQSLNGPRGEQLMHLYRRIEW